MPQEVAAASSAVCRRRLNVATITNATWTVPSRVPLTGRRRSSARWPSPPPTLASVAALRNALSTRPRRLLALLAAGLASLGVGAVMTAGGSDQPVAAAIPAVAAPGPAATLLVFVSGAVAHPGLYELAVGARIADAVADAGGILPTADPGKLPNLAGLLHDGHQVNVPFAKGTSARASAKIDANSATAGELETIPGITPDIAQAIVQTRSAWGPFAGLADLRNALGLDTATATLIGKHLSFVTDLP
jgi:competence protein ComEA